MRKLYLIVAVLLLLTGAKASIGNDFNAQYLPKLEIGKTTLQEAISLLGTPPAQSNVGVSGATGYTWQRVDSKVGFWSGKVAVSSKQVVLVFSPDGTFQRIFQMKGFQLDPEAHERLFVRPAAEHRAILNSSQPSF
ncbi:MAG: hypothetical protein ACRESJ_11650 [Pseudomonas sp.]|uniref:hypothetical protein n=1 Tax=Pseudomonas sp. TaxID=306 RepID=UPI003D6F69C5